MALETSSVSEQRLLLDSVSWEDYSRLLRALADRRIRLTYDRGTLEIMTPTPEHERFKHLLRRLIDVLTEELKLKSAGFGSMTCRRRKRRRGLEPDECYYIANQHLVRQFDHIDLRRDPPPDLALEIDVTNSSLDRLPIYASLGVAEVWRYESQVMTFHVLDASGKYQIASESQSFPGLNPADLGTFITMRKQLEDDNAVIGQFRDWVRQKLVARGG
ncbi:MAG: Uma2 family endonuclease [Candidatus Acidiferrum sp.]